MAFSLNKKCKNCRYGVKKGEIFECRYNPPFVYWKVAAAIEVTSWPKMDPDEWCNKFKPSINKLVENLPGL